jgi:hypothetical protein
MHTLGIRKTLNEAGHWCTPVILAHSKRLSPKKKMLNSCWWLTPVILLISRQRSGQFQFETGPGQIVLETVSKEPITYKKKGVA